MWWWFLGKSMASLKPVVLKPQSTLHPTGWSLEVAPAAPTTTVRNSLHVKHAVGRRRRRPGLVAIRKWRQSGCNAVSLAQGQKYRLGLGLRVPTLRVGVHETSCWRRSWLGIFAACGDGLWVVGHPDTCDFK